MAPKQFRSAQMYTAEVHSGELANGEIFSKQIKPYRIWLQIICIFWILQQDTKDVDGQSFINLCTLKYTKLEKHIEHYRTLMHICVYTHASVHKTRENIWERIMRFHAKWWISNYHFMTVKVRALLLVLFPTWKNVCTIMTTAASIFTILPRVRKAWTQTW